MAATMNQAVATCWTCLLLSAFFLCEPVLSKGGGRGGARGSSRGTSASSRGGQAGGHHHRGGGTTRSRFRGPGRSSATRVAGAAAAGAVVALSADGWYASAYRHSNADVGDDDDDVDYYNRTSYYESLMSSGSAQSLSSLTQVISVIVASFSPKMGYLLDSIL